MRKFLFILFIVWGFCSCKEEKRILLDGMERIPVVMSTITKDAHSFLEKIEIIPLETNDSSFIHRIDKCLYCEELNMFAFYTSEQYVFTFNGDGKFIANSIAKKGGGAHEYRMVLDIQFNPYLNGIDLLNPYGDIYTYSFDFEYKTKRKANLEFPIANFLPLDSCRYVFTHPFLYTDQEVVFSDIDKNSLSNSRYDGTILSGFTADKECFYKIGGEYYFVPEGINYNIYQIDTIHKELVPIIYLDFGDNEIDESRLPGFGTGKRVENGKERLNINKKFDERLRYIRDSEEIFPVIRLLSNEFIYLLIKKGSKGTYHYIYNRSKKEGFLVKHDKPHFVFPYFAISDNILFAVCQPTELFEYVDRNFLSDSEIEKLEKVKEDDNPIILKFFLKR